MSNSLRPRGLLDTRLPCPLLSAGVCLNSCLLSWWGHPTSSSSATLFSFSQSFPAIKVFSSESALHIRWPKYWNFSFSISLLMNIQGWFSLGLTGLITLQSRDSQESSPALQFKTINSLVLILLYGPTLRSIHDYWKNHSFHFVGKVMSLLFNTLSRFVIAFLPRSKRLLISWLQSPSTVILEPKKIKSVTASTVSLSICYEMMGSHAVIFIFWNVEF